MNKYIIEFLGTFFLVLIIGLSQNQVAIGLPNNVTISGALTVNGGTSLGNDVNDQIIVTGSFNSNLVPLNALGSANCCMTIVDLSR